VWDDDDDWPYAARVLVYRHDWTRPANGTAKWSEFHQTIGGAGGSQVLSPFWRRMPSHMLGKVAESLALRRAFPNDASYHLAATFVGDDTASTITEATTTPETTSLPPPDGEGWHDPPDDGRPFQ
jgi:hypothetical protein